MLVTEVSRLTTIIVVGVRYCHAKTEESPRWKWRVYVGGFRQWFTQDVHDTSSCHTHKTSFQVGCKKQIYYLFQGPEFYKYCVTPRPICIKYVCWRSIRYSLKSCISFQTGFCNRIRNLLMENHTPTRLTPAPRRSNSRVFYVTPHRFAALFFLHSSLGVCLDDTEWPSAPSEIKDFL